MQIDSAIEQVVLDIKEEMESRVNRLKYMKLRTFLSLLGYRKRKREVLDLVDECLNEHGITVYAYGEELEDWFDISHNETITFRFVEEQTSSQGSKSSFAHAGTIEVSTGNNPVSLYIHQIEAIKALDDRIVRADKTPFAELLVIPTGGGKTLTAVQWVLRNVIDNGQKVLWIAHRHELLNQALSAVQRNAYANLLRKRKQFRYRVLSGQHDKPVNIQRDDDFIVASKDSINQGMRYLFEKWLDGGEQVFLVIDEAHHSTAKTYRNIIDELRQKTTGFRMLGLTATPFRTSPNEQGLLKRIFDDDIVYKVDLKTLINRGILAKPIFRELNTQLDISEEISDEDVKRIKAFDLPEDIAETIAQNKERNNFIVEHYIANQDEYGQLLVFALNIDHAIALNALFNQRGIASAYVVSSIRDAFTHVTRSPEENKENIRLFKEGSIKVLINVEILTEGTDLPNVQTVFLTRPTTSSILMTQMIGRALRGERAGGTEKAYVVSFVDGWRDKIAWVNPERLYIEEAADFNDSTREGNNHLVRLVSIEKMEEFAKMMDSTIDTRELENISFLERIPVGLYSFSIDYDSVSKNCDILIYDCMREAYRNFVNDLDVLFEREGIQDAEYLDEDRLDDLCDTVKHAYFDGYDMLPNYRDEDIKDILRYYALKGIDPTFLEFNQRPELDLTSVARNIYDQSLGGQARKEYIDSVWEDDKNFWKVFFGNEKRYFKEQIDIEIRKIEDPDLYQSQPSMPKVREDEVDMSRLSLWEIRQRNLQYWRKLTDEVYEKSKDSDGLYTCAISGFKSDKRGLFEIDHIVPMSKGGLTEIGNLQVLTRRENRIKSDK